MMKIIADENIPYVREAFSAFGTVHTLPGRAITREALADANVLLVRSITRVDRDLLEGTPVRFVATATIGEDHVDKAYLQEKGIAFSAAPGCNAGSVCQYVTAALLSLADAFGLRLDAMTLGIVGVGNVGGRVWKAAEALGMRCMLNDPPLADKTGDPRYRPIAEILDCDIITLHTPLEKTGPYPTWHLADASFLGRMQRDGILINTARGAVADNQVVTAALQEGHLRAAVLDVWENEPHPEIALVEAAFIATPHIAGYSFDGKVNGTRQIYEALCAHLGVTPTWDPSPLLPAPECPEIRVNPDDPRAVSGAVRAVYDIMRDDAAMRGILTVPESERGAYFDRLRKEYPRRREFFNTRVRLTRSNTQVAATLSGIGFNVSD